MHTINAAKSANGINQYQSSTIARSYFNFVGDRGSTKEPSFFVGMPFVKIRFISRYNHCTTCLLFCQRPRIPGDEVSIHFQELWVVWIERGDPLERTKRGTQVTDEEPSKA